MFRAIWVRGEIGVQRLYQDGTTGIMAWGGCPAGDFLPTIRAFESTYDVKVRIDGGVFGKLPENATGQIEPGAEKEMQKDTDNLVLPEHRCPKCGNMDADQLLWLPDDDGEMSGDFVQCQSCGYIYEADWQANMAK